MADGDDRRRVVEEIRRCELLAPRYRTWSDGSGLHSDHAYYLARARVLRCAVTADAVRFLREEALRALTGEEVGGIAAGHVARWSHLRSLAELTNRRVREYSRPLRQTVNINRVKLAAIGAAPGGDRDGQ